jgi:acyl-[acyl-carrier-protein]-phospholipid O-acyltransferase/long-chain-fatty-acid--[acyl-carrier-protein] ligase
MTIDGVEAAAVTSIPDPLKGERLVAFYVSDKDLSPEEVWKALGRSDLPKLWIPKAGDLLPLGSLPVLGTGKTDLKQIKSLAAAHAMAPSSAASA